MTPITLTSKVGPDGVLKFSVAIGKTQANREVKITVESIEESTAKPALNAQQWKQFVEEMGGCIDDPTFVRHEQGEFEQRGEMFP